MATGEEVSREQVGERLRAILADNKDEIEAALVARMRNTGLDIPVNVEAMVGVRASASESLNVMIESFEQGDDWEPVLPPALVAQIEYGARQGISMEAVVRGMGIIGSVFLDAMLSRLDDRESQAVMRYMAAWQGRNSDKVMTAFVAAYTNEVERLNQSPARELRERVKMLIAGGPVDTAAFDYRLDLCHFGLVVVGEGVDLICRRLAEAMGCDLLIVPEGMHTFWAWLGAPRPLAFTDLERSAAGIAESVTISAGEPRMGVDGWRLSHLEAEAAAPVATLEGNGLVRHSDVALLASALCHAEVGESIIGRYLTPLEHHRDADDLRSTLRAYFELSCNAASAASTLGVNRHTVQRRLKRVEEAIGEPPSTRHAEFSVALRLERLTSTTQGVTGN